MSQWHREHPELTGTGADPWMIHESYRKLVPSPEEPPLPPPLPRSPSDEPENIGEAIQADAGYGWNE